MRKKRRRRALRLRLDATGRIRIPARALAKARLKPGDAVEIAEVPGGLILRRPGRGALAWEGDLLVHTGVPTEDLVAAERRMREEDLEREVRRSWPR